MPGIVSCRCSVADKIVGILLRLWPRAVHGCTARLTPVPPDEGKCRSSARQTGYRCPRTIFYQDVPSYVVDPKHPSLTTLASHVERLAPPDTLPGTFHVIACACPSIRTWPSPEIPHRAPDSLRIPRGKGCSTISYRHPRPSHPHAPSLLCHP